MKKLLISSLIASIALIGCGQQTNSTKQEVKTSKEIVINGIRKSPLNAGSENLPKLDFNAPAPGGAKLIKKSFPDAPPMIPHSVKGMAPIKVGHNQCLMCHMPQNAKMFHAVPMPKDHFVDNFKGDKKKRKVAGSRYFCMTCHTPQANVDPVIENNFEKMKTKAGLQ